MSDRRRSYEGSTSAVASETSRVQEQVVISGSVIARHEVAIEGDGCVVCIGRVMFKANIY